MLSYTHIGWTSIVGTAVCKCDYRWVILITDCHWKFYRHTSRATGCTHYLRNSSR